MSGIPDITIDDWKGLYSRGFSDTTPPGYFLDCQNVIFNESDVLTRPGSVKSLSQTNIVRFFMYKRLGEAPRVIYLLNNGQLYDSLYAPPIWTDASMVDFSMVTFNNRAYITPHNRITGIPGKFLLVYEGNGIARLAGQTSPTGFSLAATNSGASGNIQAGIHLVAVAWETTTGFISPPGPGTFGVLTATGNLKAVIANLPLTASWPANVVALRILVTKLINPGLFTGNQNAYTLYFLPSSNGGRLTASTGSAVIDFFDTDLVNSADYLFDEFPNIPAGVGIGLFGGRILVWAPNGLEHVCLVSKAYDPESFDQVSGFFTCDPSESTTGIRNCAEFRSSLYIAKSNRVYSTTDNGNDPSTWSVVPTDRGAGTEAFGFATILDSRGQEADRFFMADRSGLLTFEGYFKRPEVSWLIQDYWARINFAHFDLVQVIQDPTHQAILIAVPLDGATSLSHVFYCYYGNAITIYGFIDPKEVKWAIWQLPAGLTSIVYDIDTVTKVAMMKFSCATGIFDVKSSLHNDDGVAIDSWVKTALMTRQVKWINQVSRINLRVLGNGTLQCSVSGIDNVNNTTLPSIVLGTAPGKETEIKLNFQNERASFKFRTSLNGEWFNLTRLDIFIKPLWAARAL